MGADQAVAARLRLLVAALEADVQALDAHRSTVSEALKALPWQEGAPLCAAVSVALHHYYGGVESLMERVAQVFEGVPVKSDRWHQDLLFAMTLSVQGLRPPLWSAESLAGLRELLGFRHFFRHAYAVALDPAKLERLARSMESLHEHVLKDVRDFVAFVEEAADGP